MESSWRQAAALCPYLDNGPTFLAKLLVPTPLGTWLFGVKAGANTFLGITNLGTDYWVISTLYPVYFGPAHFPGGYEVYADDLPVPPP